MLHDVQPEPSRDKLEDRSVAVVENPSQTLLQVVPVRVHGPGGSTRDTLALLDPGSQTSLCADAVVNDLGLTGEDTQLLLRHIGGNAPPQRSQKFKLFFTPLTDEEKEDIIVHEAFSVPQVNIKTPIISTKVKRHFNHLKGLSIPDCSGGKIELLLGANVVEAVLQRDVRVGSVGQPIAVRTAFGWAITGSMTESVPDGMKEVLFLECTSSEVELGEIIKQWWTTESFGTKHTGTETR